MFNTIWIDPNIDKGENLIYAKELKSMNFKELKLLKIIPEAIDYLKAIKFEETKIIVSGKLYAELVANIKENIKDIYTIPKIIVFTSNEGKFIEKNNYYQNEENKFYNNGRIAVTFEEVKKFLFKDNENDIKNNSLLNSATIKEIQKLSSSIENMKEIVIDEILEDQLTFECIDKKEKLILPLFFQTLIDKVKNDNLEEYTHLLYNTYSNKYKQIGELLGPILSIPNIPIEMLSKYYARLFTFESGFYKDLNKDLINNKMDKYLPFIKTLYEGVKLKSLPTAENTKLYRGGKISKKEINKLKKYMENENKDLPRSIMFCKSFLSFSKIKSVAEGYLILQKKNDNFSKVLYILERDNNKDQNLSNHASLEEISDFPKEKEVLLFPFSSFEVQYIKETKLNKENIYEIKLLYLYKYLKDIENDKNLVIDENKISDSDFKDQLTKFGLVQKEKIGNINTKVIIEEYKQFEKEANNFITGEIHIRKNDINENIQIINSFENVKRMNENENKEDDWEYENEELMKENIQIKINGKKIDFSYLYKFEKEGIYTIKYKFKKSLTKINHMFYDCKRLIKLDLSRFNTENVNNMSYLFYFCKCLTNLDLSNFNTQYVTNMSNMFSDCSSLKNLDLSNLNTQNVSDMSHMFNNCSSLQNLDISNFNTQNVTDMKNMFDDCSTLTSLDLLGFITINVTDMSFMFSGCNSLINLDISKFNTENVTNMFSMFFECTSLKKLNLSNFNTENVTNMSFMFGNCKNLINLDLSKFNSKNITNMSNMFDDCKSLKKENIITKDKNIINLL